MEGTPGPVSTPADDDVVRNEVERIKRVSDLMCSCHNSLRHQYARRSLILDIAIMALTLWLTAMAFVDPRLGSLLSPSQLGKDLWLGLISVIAFFLAVLQFRVDWKGRSEAHARAQLEYGRIKQEAARLLGQPVLASDVSKLSEFHRHVGDSTIPVDDNDFLKLKQRHRLKIEVSRYLDKHPGASQLILRMRIWFRDTF